MSGPPTVAAIDCGTNTIRLLVGALPDVDVRESRIVRLGQGVDATGRLAQEALDRTFAALDDYAATIRELGATRVRMCATSAVRDASNGAEFIGGVQERLGVGPDILTGEQEAELSFAGAVRELRGPVAEPLLVLDIGGGSTELTLGTRHRDGVRRAHSMDVGSVRLTERHLHSDPPTAAEVAACVADVDAALDASPVPVHKAGTVVGVAGTVLTVVAGVLGLDSYDKVRIDQTRLDPAGVIAYVDGLVAMSTADRLALPFMQKGRADVIGAGALILSRVLSRAGTRPCPVELIASEADILDGIAWSLA